MVCELNHNTNNKIVTKKKKRKKETDHLACQLECALTVDEQVQWAERGLELWQAARINQSTRPPAPAPPGSEGLQQPQTGSEYPEIKGLLSILGRSRGQ